MANKDKKTGRTESGLEYDEDTGEVTDLVASTDGSIMPATFDDILAHGFVQVQKIKIGDPKQGGILAYAGQLLGPSAPVHTSIPDGKGGLIEGMLPTWRCHPATVTIANGELSFTPQRQIMHDIICPHQLNSDCSALYEQMQQTGKLGMFAARWQGKDSIKGGARNVNQFVWRERLDANPEAETGAKAQTA